MNPKQVTIKNIIFDFGDVFINLDKHAPVNRFLKLGITASASDFESLSNSYEIGEIDTNTFLHQLQKWTPKASKNEIIDAWNSILQDFPLSRFHFLQELASQKKYKLFLLSNTNNLHIDWIKRNVTFFNEFKACFNNFYLSQEIGLRKPNLNSYQFVINENNLVPSQTLLIDDLKQNTDAANTLGINIWNLIPKKDDVSQLFTKKTSFQWSI